MKNRLAVARWWAEKVNKSSVIFRDNTHYGIGHRSFIPSDNKAWRLTQERLSQIKDPHIRLSLELQWQFGLRREEAIKFTPALSDKEDKLHLIKGTKGGRPREIPIRTVEQRELLDRVHGLAGRGSLIPATRSYKDQLNLFEYQTRKASLSGTHGLRHQYAQDRYHELTGRLAPIAGGAKRKELSIDEKQQDSAARQIISEELGHTRVDITNTYLGI